MLSQQKENSSQEKHKLSAIPGPGIGDIVLKTLKKWPWIIVSVVVITGLVWLTQERIQPTYKRTAQIAIKLPGEKGTAGATVAAEFASLGLSNASPNFSNEIYYLKSPDLFQQVVEAYGLDVSVYKVGILRDDLLYGSSSPVIVKFPSLLENESASCELHLTKGNTFTVSNLEKNGKEVEDFKGEGTYGKPLSTPIGQVLVEKSPYFADKFASSLMVYRQTPKAAAKMFLSEFTAYKDKSDVSTVLTLTVNDASGQRATDVLNGVMEAYTRGKIRDRAEVAQATTAFINDRLSLIEKELGSVDSDISSFKSQNLMPDVSQVASLAMTENNSASQQLLNLNNQLQMCRYLKDHIMSSSAIDHVLPANTGVSNPNIEGQIAQYNALVIQLSSLASTGSDSNPVIADINSRLAQLRSNIISSVDSELRNLTQQIRTAEGLKSHSTSQLSANPNQARYLLSVERQQKVKESLYLFLLQKREENELAQAYTGDDLKIVQTPDGPAAPIAPDSSRIIMIAFAVGLILPFGWVYFRESIDNTLRGRKDLVNVTVPVLGEIPMATGKSGKKTKNPGVVVNSGGRDIMNEAFRVVRTNLRFMADADRDHNGKGGEVIMVTSFNPASGKTFLTMNMAMSLALKGEHVLVIDGDMRRGSTSGFIGSPSHGFSDFLTGKTPDWKSLVRRSEANPDLFIMPIGQLPPNPTELLENGMFSKLLEAARKEYDYIFIDCPPVDIVADAKIINPLVDRTVFVLRSGLLDRALLETLQEFYDEKEYRNMCLILNCVHVDNTPYGARYGNRYYGRYYAQSKD